MIIDVVFVGNISFVSAAAQFPLSMPGVQPMQNETYLCTAFHFAPNQHKYIVSFEPNATMHVAHHVLIYGCATPGYREWDSPRVVWDCGETESFGATFPKRSTCEKEERIVYAWARDAPALKLPEGVGFKIGGNSGINYLVLQVHYADATPFLDGVTRDTSGIVLSLLSGDTNEVRRRAGVLRIRAGGMIPARHWENMEVACQFKDNITLYPFAFRTHTHSLGKLVTGYVVKNGTWINIGKHNPLEAQMFYPAKSAVTIVRGDILAARCSMYNYRSRDTYDGPTNDDEMCAFYFMYYVEGDEITSMEECRSQGPPSYYWRKDPLLRNLITSDIDKDASTPD
ncbi:peptidylglycine alpha-hydroxylating monooxygenase-like [Ixodes scapularis]|uniref:peptidylglycine alpha-hydroxylating monooxygenase-like n=1 Tax=Ixodes scapularis TaxID=6945 RepID=UPI001C38DFB8|nr:peptidylglycine alpha-hydroxylating monooxygenase-like [Ixodes scapularis]